jgi:hypothetical protein
VTSSLRAISIFGGIVSAQQILFLVLYAAIFLLCAWALVDCLVRPTRAFPAAGKRTKTFWLLITAIATAVSFVALPLGGGTSIFGFLAFIGVVGAIVYLVDVRPAVAPYSRRRGRGGRGGGSSRGGW